MSQIKIQKRFCGYCGITGNVTDDQFLEHLNDCEIWSCKIIEKKHKNKDKNAKDA